MDVIVSMNQTLFGKPTANVVCFSNFIEDPTFLQTFANIIRASWEQYASQFLTQSWTLNDLTISFLLADKVDYSVRVPFDLGALTGTSAGEALAPQTSLLVSTSYVGSRPNRGRVYFTAFTEDAQAEGLWAGNVLNAFDLMVTDWANGLTVDLSTVFLRILRRPGGLFPAYTSSPVDLVGSTAPARTQRRRARDI